jgi:hypothetical protein
MGVMHMHQVWAKTRDRRGGDSFQLSEEALVRSAGRQALSRLHQVADGQGGLAMNDHAGEIVVGQVAPTKQNTVWPLPTSVRERSQRWVSTPPKVGGKA